MVTGCLPPSTGSDCLHISKYILYSAVPALSKVGQHTLTQCQLQIHISLWTRPLKHCLCSDLRNYDLSISKILVTALPPSTPFRNIKDSFTYLGVKITPTIESMIPTNYDPVIKSAMESLNRWKSLPLSMIGHINVLKMNILPRFLYLFQTIPLAPPHNFFVKMKNMFCNYIWSSRRSRLRMTLLYLPYDRGGLKLLFLQGYYWAAQLRAASHWFEH